MRRDRNRWTYVVSQALIFLMAFATVATAQFGVGLEETWTDFHDPMGRFTLSVPPGWSYQAGHSDSEFYLFFGPGDYDLFYLELLPANAADSPAGLAADTLAGYAAPGGLSGFRTISQPSAGTLGGRPAAFIVYAYTEQGALIHEGRAFVVVGDTAYSLAFADAATRFDSSIATFNKVMASLTIHESTSPATFGFGLTGSEQQAQQLAPGHQGATSSNAQAPGTYTSPGGFYRFALPDGWELWEEQSTARGDTIEPWNGVFEWGNRPMTKTLFIWDYFDEWEQTGAQYEIVLGVTENVPGTQTEAIEQLKERVTGGNAHIYTTETSRVRVGAEPAMQVQVVTRPGLVEPWSMGPMWYKEVTFYVFKKGTTLFIWTVPNEIVEHPAVIEAVESFEWLAR